MDKKRIGSFVIGGLAGMIAGVLLAPKSGRETRGGFADRAGEARQRSTETYFDARERLRERASATAAANQPRRAEPEVAHDLGHPPETEFAPERDAGRDTERDTEPQPRPLLRDVSLDASQEAAEPETGGAQGESDPEAARQSVRSEELRRKIRETRDRLKSQREADDVR